MRVPLATYRLQFGDGMGFADAARLIPYLDDLGVSDVYASPLFASRPGTSGYHVTDPTRLDPSLGTREEFDRFTDELRARGMGLLLDIVPNHLAASAHTPWWADVLRRGRGSRYAQFFDVDWKRHGGRILVPVLDAPLDTLLERRDLTVGVKSGEPVFRYHVHTFPIDPSTVAGAATADELLERQHYVLAHWRDAAEQVNYRRFFDISDLVAVRQEDPEVFEATHALVVELVGEGRVTGLRVDHVDGLRDPLGYLRRLRDAIGQDVPIYVEKILAPGERLPEDWPVQGTTGYEVGAALTDLFVDPTGWNELRAFAAERTGRNEPFEEVAASKRRLVLEELFSGQVRALVQRLRRLLGRSGPSEAALAAALSEVTCRMPVYRTYVRDRTLSRPDRRVLHAAFRAARGSLRGDARAALPALRSVLLLERTEPRALDLVMTWQQLTGAVAAKGVEDSALFDFPVLTARNDVGSDPGLPPAGPRGFHELCRGRVAREPDALSATSTHDSKRSGDVRARIAAISERAGEWRSVVARWDRLAEPLRRRVEGEQLPDPGSLSALWQDVLGVWPLDPRAEKEFPDRIERFVLKAAREARVHTSWLDPAPGAEEALDGFVRDLFGREGEELRAALERFRGRIEVAGCVTSLATVVCKIAAPGVPDLYEGTERWFLRLVDPDNRDPGDPAEAEAELRSLPAPSPRAAAALLRSWRDGRIKLHVTRAALEVRRNRPDLFRRGAWVPLRAGAAFADNVVAFARRRRGEWALVAAPRLTASLVPAGRFPVGERAWGRGSLALPSGAPKAWVDVLTGREIDSARGAVRLAELFGSLPVALLVMRQSERTS